MKKFKVGMRAGNDAFAWTFNNIICILRNYSRSGGTASIRRMTRLMPRGGACGWEVYIAILR